MATRRKSSVPTFETSSRKVEQAKGEDREARGILEDTRTRQQRGRDELEYGRSYRRTPGQRKARQQASRGRQRVIQQASSADLPAVGVSVDDGAGVLLGFLVWIVVLNYIQGGPTKVRQLLKAKFFNQGPDGKELP